MPGPYLQEEFGWSVSLVGLCFGVCAILYAIASPVAGYADTCAVVNACTAALVPVASARIARVHGICLYTQCSLSEDGLVQLRTLLVLGTRLLQST